MRLHSAIIARFGADYVKLSSTDEVIYKCPFCESIKGSPDKKGHLYVHVKKLVYFCHRCESKGSLVRENDDYIQDIEPIGEILKRFKSEKKDPYPYYIPSKFPYSSENAYKYLLDRGIDDELQQFYDIRVGDAFSDMFGRIIIPNIVVRTNWTDMYVGRTFIGNKRRYKNPDYSQKAEIVFNLHRIKEGEPVIITEGVFSAISAGKNAVATYGKYVSDMQVKKILKNRPSLIYVCLDSDAYQNSVDICEKLLYTYRNEVRVVDLPLDKDPSDLGSALFQEYLSKAKPYSKAGVIMKKFLSMKV